MHSSIQLSAHEPAKIAANVYLFKAPGGHRTEPLIPDPVAPQVLTKIEALPTVANRAPAHLKWHSLVEQMLDRPAADFRSDSPEPEMLDYPLPAKQRKAFEINSDDSIPEFLLKDKVTASAESSRAGLVIALEKLGSRVQRLKVYFGMSSPTIGNFGRGNKQAIYGLAGILTGFFMLAGEADLKTRSATAGPVGVAKNADAPEGARSDSISTATALAHSSSSIHILPNLKAVTMLDDRHPTPLAPNTSIPSDPIDSQIPLRYIQVRPASSTLRDEFLRNTATVVVEARVATLSAQTTLGPSQTITAIEASEPVAATNITDVENAAETARSASRDSEGAAPETERAASTARKIRKKAQIESSRIFGQKRKIARSAPISAPVSAPKVRKRFNVVPVEKHSRKVVVRHQRRKLVSAAPAMPAEKPYVAVRTLDEAMSQYYGSR